MTNRILVLGCAWVALWWASTSLPAQELQPLLTGDSEVRSTESAGESQQWLDCFPEVVTESASQFPEVKITGVVQLDAAYFSQNAANRNTLGDIEDGLGFRRARLAAKGKVTPGTSYIVEFDFAQSQARFVDVWMEFAETRFGNVRLGRYRQPFGMSEMTSIRELPFLERPMTFTQSPFRQTGIMCFDASLDGRRTRAISGYRFLSDNFGNAIGDSGGYGLASRLTTTLLDHGDNHLVHLGSGYSYNDPARGIVQLAYTNELFIGQNPNLGPAGLNSLPIVGVPPFVNSGPLGADALQLLNLEAGIARGPLAIQSEARWASVEQSSGSTVQFPGAYLHLRYVLTGEDIPYDRKSGTFRRVQPLCPFTKEGGIGAIEVGARLSHLDLIAPGINGRRLTDMTLGATWYWNAYTKFQVNWIHSRLDDAVLGSSLANAFAMRAELNF